MIDWKRKGTTVRVRNAKKIMILGAVTCLLTGCGNAIPELTEEEASLIATYAADVVLESSKEGGSRLMDTEKEKARLEELSAKIEQLKKDKASQEEESTQETGQPSYSTASGVQRVENIADFIGLEAFQVNYEGYEIVKSYAADREAEWEPTFDASAGKNLLVLKFNATNMTDAPAVLDVLNKDTMFSIRGDNGINNMSYVTMLLNDFSSAQDEIGAGESRQYVLITQIDETITEVGSLSLHMKKGDESADALLQ